ncbi:MAG: acetyl-CoA C-acyltransferase [Candidatus Melainabacteria bacterium]|nr:MAG: acetyl-CoA C-acyltransferase [Candidatus Melainabacteria bacterium]
MKEAVIVDAVRTPIGRYGGALKSWRPDDLAAFVISAILKRNQIPVEELADVIFGCANQAGEDNRNVGRMAVLLAGLPASVPGVTINRLCGSGLSAVIDACRAIETNNGEIFIAGGVESMTRAPLVMLKPEVAYPRGNLNLADTTLGWRFVNEKLAKVHHPYSLGETAENVAEKYAISRQEQDEFACESQAKYKRALKAKKFAQEIVPIPITGGKKANPEAMLENDEHPRPDTTLADLAKLEPVFRQNGSVTAGNSSGLNDGAAALLIMSKEMASRLGAKPLARFVSSAVTGVDPAYMGMGPVSATEKALALAQLPIKAIDLVEMNEAFAAQSLACLKELKLNPDIVNVNGGAIALGHPIGCSGARILTTLVHEMERLGARLGLATMCIGVGQGIATVVSRE